MPRRIVEAGRMDVRGADVRFKAKGTLEAYDRNLATLAKVRVRSTPAPGLRLFADFEFPEEVFRVFQDTTLINYKEFLEQVAFSGIDNFRALVRHASRAFVEGAHDAATKEFGEGKPPERFVSVDELAAYDGAVSSGDTPNVARSAPTGRDAGTPEYEAAKRHAAEEAWKKFTPDIERAEAERVKRPRTGGWILIAMGLVTLGVSLATMKQAKNLPEGAPNVYPLLALGMLLGVVFLAAGVLFVRPAD